MARRAATRVSMPSAQRGASARLSRAMASTRMRRISILLLMAFAPAPIWACSFFADTQSLSASDAAAEDAEPESASNDASTASPDAAIDASADTIAPQDAGPPNLLRNGDFEDGCAFWKTNASGTTIDVAHSGSAACLVCSTYSDVFIEQSLPAGAPDPKGKSFV